MLKKFGTLGGLVIVALLLVKPGQPWLRPQALRRARATMALASWIG